MNKKFVGFFLALILIASAAIWFKQKSKTPVTLTSNKPKVAATIFPIFDITRNIAGDKVDVRLILPSGASPHTFEPSPQEIKNLVGSQAVFMINHGVDDWATKLSQTAAIKNQIILDKNIRLINDNPHYWLSVKNAQLIAAQIKDELSSLYPQYGQYFADNLANYSAQLDSLDKEIASQLSNRNVKIATFHNAWDYFARDYNINVVAVFEEFPGKEPSPTYLADFQSQIRTSNTKIIFAEPQFSTDQLDPIAADLGVKISVLDPLGGEAQKDSYIGLMRYNLNKILEAK